MSEEENSEREEAKKEAEERSQERADAREEYLDKKREDKKKREVAVAQARENQKKKEEAREKERERRGEPKKKKREKVKVIRDDPFKSYVFRIEIDGIEVFGFREVSGLSNKTDFFEYQEGGENQYTHKFVGQTTFSNLILKNGIVLDNWVYEWRELVIDGKIKEALRTISIVLSGGTSSNDRVWKFYDVWPCKWESSKFDAMHDGLAIETLELALSRGEEEKKS